MAIKKFMEHLMLMIRLQHMVTLLVFRQTTR
uniref:Uncharacterized protein n=1 Tax=virus sp. ctBM815 TaxID=2825806 RepID=A0A8S5RL37_9VIRU|nr:MAG TPA: hypothetical protein [virus sp. ctBM815]